MNLFSNLYNLEHKHSGIKYVTPDERYRGIDVKYWQPESLFIDRPIYNILNVGVSNFVIGTIYKKYI
ncbi:hypothetical protein ADQ49_26445 [Salmonella enterica subsp. enterica]|nr:hypothetical protein [Salmonella enterica subsp. enterica serovar Enteritidis]EAB4413567.1 hypothetical protein [Salmonella enterica]